MEKYYKPEISEFHVGFEFEMADTWGGWRKMVLTEELLKNPLVSIGSGNERIPYYVNTRVKYLDKRDIESLGFTEISDGWYHQFPNLNEKGYQILYKIGETFNLSFGVHEHSNHLFSGKIKNISELKVLLKQLNIIEL